MNYLKIIISISKIKKYYTDYLFQSYQIFSFIIYPLILLNGFSLPFTDFSQNLSFPIETFHFLFFEKVPSFKQTQLCVVSRKRYRKMFLSEHLKN